MLPIDAQPHDVEVTTNPSKPRLQIVQTSTLSIGCEISGPRDGRPVFLLHGWPDDPRTWDRLLPSLHAAGWRTFAPYLRGFGPTRFRHAGTMRSGQLSALGQDLLDLADALGLERFALVGHDWGARAAYIASAAAPMRVTHCCALSVGWGTNHPGQDLPLHQIQNYWYHWYMALDRGAEMVRDKRRELTRYIWTIWTRKLSLSDSEFEATAVSFDNPDWADIVLHSYRVRWGLASTDPAYDAIEARLADDSLIRVPTLVIHGADDPCNDPSTSDGKERLFVGSYQRVVLNGIGHFPQREAADEVVRHLIAFLERNG